MTAPAAVVAGRVVAGRVGLAPTRDEPAIVVRGLTKAYGRTRVVDALDLAIPGAMLTAIVGGNGAGKSTLLGCLAGVLRHGGSVRLGGPIGAPRPGRVAYLPQRIRLPAGATVDEVMRLFRSLAGPATDRVVPPDGFLVAGHRRIGELSGGQAQRVVLAATLLGTPDLLLLDEPLANLDDGAKGVVREMLVAHRDAGATILVASPAAFELLADADEVIRIEGGGVAFQGPGATYLAGLRTTVWVALDPADDGSAFHELAAVERTRIVGRWAALDCRGRDVSAVIGALGDRGVAAARIRVAGPADAAIGPQPADGRRTAAHEVSPVGSPELGP
ncbi:MAG: ATP-binding cassette domain-containing protein [Chloroflexota bacterium]